MAKKKTAKKISKKRVNNAETDSQYFLKLVVFLILGAQWIRVESFPEWSIPIPVGLIVGLVFASHDQFQIDRKIEYVVLLIAAFIAFWLPMGIVISL